ncbi:enoyl-CoA hydratase/isomerase family protein [Roseovarius indicus]|uniref:4-chlorobenzoyl coenzyme A dehalogenase-2 n=1 Tax=Roseovarius indicus TaxID=540747 RepID=A0A0T5P5Q6_9RHOB|nr:enoyl-CoA hydratase/isomerase family protein [Roseovarius indicus]KRS16453.1 enoyl-CoA hydratase [Roseovarius indicus]QEW28087.1 4-chlorobenzoyl coenzyme A dehalogenase-2 [Roseovarius indicus]SFE53809.1 Enoyl-CoA hydratase/carnithine racemase [Roseovarius indicus]
MIRLDKTDGLWTVTIDRPDKANSLTEEMLTELADIAESATDARALILTGEGKVFSAGADLEAAKAGLATSSAWERLSSAITGMRGITIAALNGTVAGGAMGMVLACDLRVAVPKAKAFYPVMKLGLLPQPSDPGRLIRLVGPSRAKMILMAGQKIDAETALAWGLFDRIAEPDALMSTVHELAADTVGADPVHAATIKGMCRV